MFQLLRAYFLFCSLCNAFIFARYDILQLSPRQGQKDIGPPNWIVQVPGILYSNYTLVIDELFRNCRNSFSNIHSHSNSTFYSDDDVSVLKVG